MNGYLLDTHIFLWAMLAADKITAPVQAILNNPQEPVFVSIITAWEISLKRSLGKLHVTTNIQDAIAAAGFQPMPLKFNHIQQLDTLPLHHRDPFDRMLIAQAKSESLTLITNDKLILQYDVACLQG